MSRAAGGVESALVIVSLVTGIPVVCAGLWLATAHGCYSDPKAEESAADFWKRDISTYGKDLQ